jgi:hypothetical protein
MQSGNVDEPGRMNNGIASRSKLDISLKSC